MNARPALLSNSRDEAVEATAAAWLAERDAGLSAEDAAAFAAWRAADPRHEAAVARLESAWGAMQALREFRPESRVHPDRDLLARPKGGTLVRFPALAATAALAACLTLVATWLWTRPAAAPAAAPHVHYATTVGGYQRMTLPDGSIVDLNADTEIHERFTAGERRVALVRGEATFQVTKNAARPFVVEADGVAVRAIGTAFNVRLRTGKVDVLVTEGRVRVDPPAEARHLAAAVPELTVGQRVVAFEPITEDTDPSVLADATDVVASVAKQQELELLTKAIQSLPDRVRQIFTLRTAYGLTQREIADRLGVSESTVEKQMALGIRRCATFFSRGGAR